MYTYLEGFGVLLCRWLPIELGLRPDSCSSVVFFPSHPSFERVIYHKEHETHIVIHRVLTYYKVGYV